MEGLRDGAPGLAVERLASCAQTDCKKSGVLALLPLQTPARLSVSAVTGLSSAASRVLQLTQSRPKRPPPEFPQIRQRISVS